ncbi:C-type lectin domain family 12 member B-like isoform X2 [Hyla sarda]|uniref:C-type lectin domain family 12 member B-like isoform X2 n=1 Tax=Hyla sarda TaxID=327740 RepID=UPI0024C2D913|nr:C-type lectin domain family 12 member B-like isoform X2 [Hyla sarda]
MQNMYGNPMGIKNQVFTPDDDNDDDDYENTNPCDPKPALPSRTNRRMNKAIKDDLPLKCMNEPAKQPPSVWTTPQKGMIPKETPRFQPPAIGLDFSSGAVNAAFSDTTARNTFPELEAMPHHNKQRPGRSKMVVLTGLMVIIFLALAGVTAFISLRYIAVAEKVVDLEETVSDLQKNAKSEQGNVKAEVADLNNTMVKLQDMIVVNIKQIKEIKKTLENICTRCPVGWYMNGSSCYYVSMEKVSWDEARDECYKMNSVLVMVKDKTESEALKKLFKENGRYWIGLRRDPKEVHIWKWLDGEQVTFTSFNLQHHNSTNSSSSSGSSYYLVPHFGGHHRFPLKILLSNE